MDDFNSFNVKINMIYKNIYKRFIGPSFCYIITPNDYVELLNINDSYHDFYVCRGDKQDTKGTAFVVYEDIFDAKNAVDHLNGFNVCGRYLIVLYFQHSRLVKQQENKNKQKEMEELKAKFNVQ